MKADIAAPQVCTKTIIEQVFYFDTISGTNASQASKKVESHILLQVRWKSFYVTDATNEKETQQAENNLLFLHVVMKIYNPTLQYYHGELFDLFYCCFFSYYRFMLLIIQTHSSKNATGIYSATILCTKHLVYLLKVSALFRLFRPLLMWL